jgi:cystathionine beta-lyase/cystathionine gamma-synthase
MRLDPEDVTLCIVDDTVAPPGGGAPTSTPIVMTSLFTFPTLEALQDGLANESTTHVYTRGQNPTVEVLERKLAQLERGEACKCFGSGMAAVSAVMLGVLQAGDHILFVNQTYGPTQQLAERLQGFGITHDLLLDVDAASVEAALRPNTRLVWLESPGTMTFRVLDLEAIAAVARRHGALTCIDNSWATPLLQKPITLGVDIVMHTGSKYLNGHSDLMAGAVISTAERMREIFYRSYLLNGGIQSPHDAWLVLRGLRTLPARLRQHEADALTLAHALHAHPVVRRVFHPALSEDQALVARQFRGFTGTFAFELVQDDVASVRQVVNALRHFRIGVSWGGVESLAIAPANGSNDARLAAQQIPRGTIRLSVGLEGVDVLWPDLEQALGTLGTSIPARPV